MSSRAGKMKRDLKNGQELFPNEMTNNILGSYLITLYILQSTDKTPIQLTKFYKQEKKRWLKNKVNENTWMYDIIDKLNEVTITTEEGKSVEHKDTTYIPYGKLALVIGSYNRLIAPIVKNDNGELVPLSLRRDGWKGVTLTSGTIYPIEEKVEYEVKDEETNGEE